jgi:hypothetical protein
MHTLQKDNKMTNQQYGKLMSAVSNRFHKDPAYKNTKLSVWEMDAKDLLAAYLPAFDQSLRFSLAR